MLQAISSWWLWYKLDGQTIGPVHINLWCNVLDQHQKILVRTSFHSNCISEAIARARHQTNWQVQPPRAALSPHQSHCQLHSGEKTRLQKRVTYSTLQTDWYLEMSPVCDWVILCMSAVCFPAIGKVSVEERGAPASGHLCLPCLLCLHVSHGSSSSYPQI